MTDRWAARLGVHVAIVVAAIGMGACARDHAVSPARTELWFGGDLHLGSGADADVRLAALVPLVTGAAGIVNLEGAVHDGTAREGELFNAPALLPGLRRAGIVAVGVANNHALDGGGSLAATIGAVRAAGLEPIGGPANPALLTLGGLRIAVVAYDLPPGGTITTLATDLAAARAHADVLVATFHVTAPPSYLPSREAITAVTTARAAGAAVIVVHGSHALARIERTPGSVTAWGLGNLLFACACTDEDDALLLRVTLDRSGLVDASVIPIAAGLRGAPAQPSADPALVYELLHSLRSTPLRPPAPTQRSCRGSCIGRIRFA